MSGPRRRPWPGADLPGRRVFVAVPLPAEAIAQVEAIVDAVRAEGVNGGGRDVRWVRLDGLHLTLRFVGPTLEERIPALHDAVRRLAARGAPFDAGIGEAGAFPNLTRPRALWLDMLTGATEFQGLAKELDRLLVEAGWPSDDRPFRPHLTLARSDGVPAGSAIAARLIELTTGVRIGFRVDRIGLFESLTGGGPARYEPLEVVPLG